MLPGSTLSATAHTNRQRVGSQPTRATVKPSDVPAIVSSCSTSPAAGTNGSANVFENSTLTPTPGSARGSRPPDSPRPTASARRRAASLEPPPPAWYTCPAGTSRRSPPLRHVPRASGRAGGANEDADELGD